MVKIYVKTRVVGQILRFIFTIYIRDDFISSSKIELSSLFNLLLLTILISVSFRFRIRYINIKVLINLPFVEMLLESFIGNSILFNFGRRDEECIDCPVEYIILYKRNGFNYNINIALLSNSSHFMLYSVIDEICIRVYTCVNIYIHARVRKCTYYNHTRRSNNWIGEWSIRPSGE